MTIRRRTLLLRITAVAAAAVTLMVLAAVRPAGSAATPSLGQLGSQLSQVKARQQSLANSVAAMGRLIAGLDGQIQLVQSREATMRDELAADEARLAQVKVQLVKERKLLVLLRHRLARAKLILSRQLVSSYEGDKPDLVTVVLNANGFKDLLNQIVFLGRAEKQQQTIISLTREAKAQADAAAKRLAQLQATDNKITADAALRVRALAGMNQLLSAKQAALQSARDAQQSALAATRARGHRLQTEIAHVRAQQLAAERAAAAAAAAAQQSTPTASGPALGPSGGWAIPYAIVLCESGGQNLSPNSAGASGYYQIIPSTWKLFGGSGPAAYLASKAEQDAVASRIWRGGAGASNWVCAGIVGIIH
jgi:septal ring factor EnvC (AmiA/AmiB activator)